MTPLVSTPAAEATRADLREEPPVHTFCINPVGGPNIRTEGTDRFAAEPEVHAFMDWARSTIATLTADKAAAEAALAVACAERDEARADAEKAEGDLEDAAGTPWPEWAETILKAIRKESGHDGCDDASEGVDLPAELDDLISELHQQQDGHRKALARTTAAEAQAATERARADGLDKALRTLDALLGFDPETARIFAVQVGMEDPETLRDACMAARLALAGSDNHHPHGGDDADRT